MNNYDYRDLHSNMVRFIIITGNLSAVWDNDLHSNMVRFIMFTGFSKKSHREPFTFQYG